jgi:hypothetical protein
MATIAENLQTIKDSTAAIKQSIINKGGEIRGNITTWASAIDGIETGGGGEVTTLEEKDVNFYDYDGTLLFSYTKEEFLDIDELPALPTQDGLICQGWNWSYDDAIAYVGEYGMLNIGATYITDDGRTRFFISIETEGAKAMQLYLASYVANNIEVDWGDGTIEFNNNTGYLKFTHNYAELGDYVISVKALAGNWGMDTISSNENRVIGPLLDSYERLKTIKKIQIGERCNAIKTSYFANCSNLKCISIPNNVTSIYNNSFDGCFALLFVSIPNSITSINSSVFLNCFSLKEISIPKSINSIGVGAFQSSELKTLCISDEVKEVPINLCGDCYHLKKIVIPNNITTLNSGAFYRCKSLSAVVIPNSVLSVKANIFSGCSTLEFITLSENMTSLSASMLYECTLLQKLYVPKNVVTIENTALSGLRSISYIDFSTHTTIPTLSESGSIRNLNPESKIIVPDNLYDQWVAATNWSALTSYIVKDSEYTRPI